MITQLDHFIETYTGKKFYFLEPQETEVDIIDIAHSLSMQCRYTGHCRKFYSVAEHCIHVADLCSDESKLYGLLHDASEAYLTDIASPVKPFLQNYKMMEKQIMSTVYEKFGLEPSLPIEVQKIDLAILRTEADQLMISRGKDWVVNKNNSEPLLSVEIKCYAPTEAKEKFLEMFGDLYEEQ